MDALPQHNTQTVQQELAELVWKYFADEIREAMVESAEVIQAEQSNSSSQVSDRKQKRK